MTHDTIRIVCLSDTHGIHSRMEHSIPDGDILLHAGDITQRGNSEDLDEVNHFIDCLPHRHIVFIPGNHDHCFEKDMSHSISQISASATCLIDQSIEIAGLKIWGSPWQPEFHDWAFNLPRGEALAQVWSQIPEDADIVITHGPPRGILDRTSTGFHAGCDDLRERILEIEPKLHLFGHIHEAYGVETIGKTTFINASICNQGFKPVNAPIVLDLKQ